MDERTKTLLGKSASDEAVLHFDKISPQIRAFHGQQAIEKLLKAWIAALGTEPPKLHSLTKLAGLIEDQGQTLPPLPISPGEFNDYAAEWRYDDVAEESSLDDAEMRETVRILREHITAAIAELS